MTPLCVCSHKTHGFLSIARAGHTLYIMEFSDSAFMTPLCVGLKTGWGATALLLDLSGNLHELHGRLRNLAGDVGSTTALRDSAHGCYCLKYCQVLLCLGKIFENGNDSTAAQAVWEQAEYLCRLTVQFFEQRLGYEMEFERASVIWSDIFLNLWHTPSQRVADILIKGRFFALRAIKSREGRLGKQDPLLIETLVPLALWNRWRDDQAGCCCMLLLERQQRQRRWGHVAPRPSPLEAQALPHRSPGPTHWKLSMQSRRRRCAEVASATRCLHSAFVCGMGWTRRLLHGEVAIN